MSREQLTESEGQFEAGGPEAAAPAQSHQLPLHVFDQVAQIRPGDAAGLQALLARYPDLAQNIASVASHHAGMSTVKQAMAMQQAGAPVAASTPSLQQDYRPGGAAELESVTPAAPHAHAAPAWVADARRFNDAHGHLVDEFNDLTHNVLALDDTQIDPQAIARWQRDHGIAADGKVGPHTVAAARAKRDNASEVASGPAPVKAEQIDT